MKSINKQKSIMLQTPTLEQIEIILFIKNGKNEKFTFEFFVYWIVQKLCLINNANEGIQKTTFKCQVENQII